MNDGVVIATSATGIVGWLTALRYMRIANGQQKQQRRERRYAIPVYTVTPTAPRRDEIVHLLESGIPITYGNGDKMHGTDPTVYINDVRAEDRDVEIVRIMMTTGAAGFTKPTPLNFNPSKRCYPIELIDLGALEIDTLQARIDAAARAARQAKRKRSTQ